MKIVSGCTGRLSSNPTRGQLVFWIQSQRWEFPLLDPFKSYLGFLFFFPRSATLDGAKQGLLQHSSTTCKKLEWLMQKFSKQKILLLEMKIQIFTTNGVWPDTGLRRGLTEELGYELVQLHYKMWITNLVRQEVDPHAYYSMKNYPLNCQFHQELTSNKVIKGQHIICITQPVYCSCKGL